MMAAASAPSPFYPAFQERLGLAPAGVATVFALYAVVLLAALLTTGRLSDHLGRRPVISAGFALLAVSVTVFALAGSFPVLLAARALQGLASGVLLSALAAMTSELEAPDRPGSGATWNSVAPLAGLAAGAFGGGAALSLLPHALEIVFGALAAVFAVLAVVIWAAPETSPLREGWRRSFRPRIGVPPSARRAFWLGAPALLAGWANGGLFLSLGASIVDAQFQVHSHLWQGSVVGLIAAAGALGALSSRRLVADTAALLGMVGIATGTAVSLLALGPHLLAGYAIGVLLAGWGFGAAFTAVLRSVASVVGPHERAEVFASVYAVSYLSFGLPAVVAGFLVPALTLGTTALWYGLGVVFVATAAAALRLRLRLGTR
ncbi:MFS transporter [Microbacterium caowuchunii]|nr:MFS transporter [Microbacterium caowuchunii]